jgi:3-oxoacyl-[acyl-carrier protein] reductase
MFTIKAEVALVTGGSRGIGREIANGLAKQGVIVAATATSEEGAAAITKSFKDQGYNGQGFVFNANDAESIPQLLSDIKEQMGKAPTILVNNAGITRDNIVLRMKPDQWEDVITTNLNGVYRITKACLKPMVKARWGRIINITSVSGLIGNFGQANYSAAKAGVAAFSKSLAREVASFGITVNCVSPGFTRTDMTNAMPDAQREQIEAMVPQKRLAEVEEIASGVLYLASDQAAYITGEIININGGLYMP